MLDAQCWFIKLVLVNQPSELDKTGLGIKECENGMDACRRMVGGREDRRPQKTRNTHLLSSLVYLVFPFVYFRGCLRNSATGSARDLFIPEENAKDKCQDFIEITLFVLETSWCVQSLKVYFSLSMLLENKVLTQDSCTLAPVFCLAASWRTLLITHPVCQPIRNSWIWTSVDLEAASVLWRTKGSQSSLCQMLRFRKTHTRYASKFFHHRRTCGKCSSSLREEILSRCKRISISGDRCQVTKKTPGFLASLLLEEPTPSPVIWSQIYSVQLNSWPRVYLCGF